MKLSDFLERAIQRTGELGLAAVVWSVIATACFLLAFVIDWKAVLASKPAAA